MNMLDALDKIEISSDYFLVSAFMEEGKDAWTFMFFCKADNTVIDFRVGESVEKGSAQNAANIPNHENFQELDVNIKIDHLSATEKARSKIHSKPSAIYAALTMKNGSPAWSISFICLDLNAYIFDIDAKSGEIMKEDSFSLFTKL
ncbi:MAG TPA: PepSY domain-containing protein [archaeon]|nr:PepSY domain-containing protein [archaeon]